MKTSELLVKALRTTNIVSADIGNQPDARQMVDALDLLNELLSEININGDFLPYTQTISQSMVVGQETYFIENLIQWQVIAFDWQSVRYSLIYQNRTDYYGLARANNIQSFPFSFHVERTKSGSKIQFYFPPQYDFTMEITGLFGFDSVTNNTDLSIVYDNFYLKYLRLELANSICNYYTLSMPKGSAIELEKIRDKINKLNSPDLGVQINNMLDGQNFVNYAQANIGKGFTAP